MMLAVTDAAAVAIDAAADDQPPRERPQLSRGHGRCPQGSSALVALLVIAVTVQAAPATAVAPTIEERVAGALWSLFAGDALAMPVHWYYGGPNQIRRDFGGSLIAKYEQSVHPFPESIMQLSNTGGAGRGGEDGDVVGGVILHDKKKFWQRNGQFHYHQTLQPGENTLEASLVRVLMRSLTDTGGVFSADDFRSKYVAFMTTPASHNDTYASSCHRIFFQRWRAGLEPHECPGNDDHNVDTMDGVVLPAVVILAELAAGKSVEVAAARGVEAAAVTRNSPKLTPYVQALASLFAALLTGTPLDAATQELAANSYGRANLADEVRRRGDSDPVVACYVGGGFQALLHFCFKYASAPVDVALLASANAGGENVHRGAVFGALVGAAVGEAAMPRWLQEGLYHAEELRAEITAFVKAIGTRGRRVDGEL